MRAAAALDQMHLPSLSSAYTPSAVLSTSNCASGSDRRTSTSHSFFSIKVALVPLSLRGQDGGVNPRGHARQSIARGGSRSSAGSERTTRSSPEPELRHPNLATRWCRPEGRRGTRKETHGGCGRYAAPAKHRW